MDNLISKTNQSDVILNSQLCCSCVSAIFVHFDTKTIIQGRGEEEEEVEQKEMNVLIRHQSSVILMRRMTNGHSTASLVLVEPPGKERGCIEMHWDTERLIPSHSYIHSSWIFK